MAKDRDGSINIYGSLQAKTEDGYVAYTDGIAHENEDGTKTPLDQLLKDSGGIIDVDKLPQQGWSGTVVPCDGTFISDDSGNVTGVEGGTVVENLYFNTNLSIKETIAEMEKVTNWFVADGENYALFFSVNNSLILTRADGVYIINDLSGNIFFVNDGSYIGVEWSGWNPEVTYPIENNSASGSEFQGLTVGQENDKLTALFSTTPFVYEEGNINDKAIYRLKEAENTHLEGTLLVSNPETTVDKIIFNDKLSVEETVKILKSLTYTSFDAYTVNVLYSNASATHVVFALHPSEDKYQIMYSPSITDTSQAITIFTNYDYSDGTTVTGWNNTEITINDTGVSELMGLYIGNENDKLTSLLSMNDNFTEIADSYKYTYWVYKDKWVQLLTSEDGSLGPSIVDAVETLEIDFDLDFTFSEDGNIKTATFSSADAQRAFIFLADYINNKEIEISAKIFNMLVDGGDADEWLSNGQLRYENMLGTIPVFNFVWYSPDRAFARETYFVIQVVHSPSEKIYAMGIETNIANGTNIQGKLIFTKKKVQLLEVEVEQKDDYIVIEKNTSDVETLSDLSFTNEEFDNMCTNEKVILKISSIESTGENNRFTRYLYKQQDWLNESDNFKLLVFLGNMTAASSVLQEVIIIKNDDSTYSIQTNALNNTNYFNIRNFYNSGSALILEYNDRGGDPLQMSTPIDQIPTESSENLISSGGVFEAIQSAIGDINTILDEINGEEV